MLYFGKHKMKFETAATLVLLLITLVFLFLFRPPDYVISMELGQKLLSVSFYNLLVSVGIKVLGGLGFEVISYILTSRKSTVIFLAAWMLGNALVLKG